MELVVARIGRPHGLQGEVALDLRTDDPAGRLAPGSVLTTDPESAGPLTVVRSVDRQGRWYVSFAEVSDRSTAEALRGTSLLVEISQDAPESDAWFRHQLVGLRVERLSDSAVVGKVIDVEHLPAQDLLVVREPDGAVSRVPFVQKIVPVVDVAGGRVVLDPPGGLLASDATAMVVAAPDTSGQDADS